MDGEQQQHQRRLIIDTDVGLDDSVAIGTLIDMGYDIRLITTVRGVNSAKEGARCLRELLGRSTAKTLPTIAIGIEEKAPPKSSWILDCRKKLRELLSIPHDHPDETPPNTGTISHVRRILEDTAAADVDSSARSLPIGDVTETSPLPTLDGHSANVDLLCLGPLSNVAEWVSDESLQPLLKSRVDKVWIVGGTKPQSKESQSGTQKPHFNFGQDPSAAATVLTSPVFSNKLRLLTRDASKPAMIATPEYVLEIKNLAKKAAPEPATTTATPSSSSTTAPVVTTINALCARIIQLDPTAAFYDTLLAFGIPTLQRERLWNKRQSL